MLKFFKRMATRIGDARCNRYHLEHWVRIEPGVRRCEKCGRKLRRNVVMPGSKLASIDCRIPRAPRS